MVTLFNPYRTHPRRVWGTVDERRYRYVQVSEETIRTLDGIHEYPLEENRDAGWIKPCGWEKLLILEEPW